MHDGGSIMLRVSFTASGAEHCTQWVEQWEIFSTNQQKG